HLTFQFRPIEYERGVWIFGEFPPFAAPVVREEDEATFIQTFQQHNPSRGPSALVRRGQGHSGWLKQLGVEGLLEPLLKLPNRIRFKLDAPQSGQSVVFAKISEGHERSLYPVAAEVTRLILNAEFETGVAKIEPPYVGCYGFVKFRRKSFRFCARS